MLLVSFHSDKLLTTMTQTDMLAFGEFSFGQDIITIDAGQSVRTPVANHSPSYDSLPGDISTNFDNSWVYLQELPKIHKEVHGYWYFRLFSDDINELWYYRTTIPRQSAIAVNVLSVAVAIFLSNLISADLLLWRVIEDSHYWPPEKKACPSPFEADFDQGVIPR